MYAWPGSNKQIIKTQRKTNEWQTLISSHRSVLLKPVVAGTRSHLYLTSKTYLSNSYSTFSVLAMQLGFDSHAKTHISDFCLARSCSVTCSQGVSHTTFIPSSFPCGNWCFLKETQNSSTRVWKLSKALDSLQTQKGCRQKTCQRGCFLVLPNICRSFVSEVIEAKNLDGASPDCCVWVAHCCACDNFPMIMEEPMLNAALTGCLFWGRGGHFAFTLIVGSHFGEGSIFRWPGRPLADSSRRCNANEASWGFSAQAQEWAWLAPS